MTTPISPNGEPTSSDQGRVLTRAEERRAWSRPPVAPAPVSRWRLPFRGRKKKAGPEQRGIVSLADWHRPQIRWTLRFIHAVTLIGLFIIGLGPILWLAKSAVTPTYDTNSNPLALWPHGWDLNLIRLAFDKVHIERYFMNTVYIAFGSWICQIIVATTAGYALSILRPRFANVLTGMVLATLFVPSIVILLPLYLTVLDMPIPFMHVKLLDTFWAIWLPAGASAFNVIIIKRFFDNLPREIFEAAQVDGAGPFRLFWSIVLPMSRPIVGVVSVFAVIATWKDYLWPMLVLPTVANQPLSVRLPAIQGSTDLGLFLSALAISTLVPIALFLIFQRMFLSGGGLSGAIKG
jgi:multiple sugar transport system permease protein